MAETSVENEVVKCTGMLVLGLGLDVSLRTAQKSLALDLKLVNIPENAYNIC